MTDATPAPPPASARRPLPTHGPWAWASSNLFGSPGTTIATLVSAAVVFTLLYWFLDWALLREGSTAYVEHRDAGEWELYDLANDPHQLASLRDADVSEWARKTGELWGSQGRDLRRLEQ